MFKKIHFPAITLFCERFCYFGIKTGLVLYMLWEMDLNWSNAIIMSHLLVITYCMSNIIFYFLHYFASSLVTSWIGVLFHLIGFVCLIVPYTTSYYEANDKKILDTPQYTTHFIGFFLVFIGSGLTRPGIICLSLENIDENSSVWKNFTALVAELSASLIVPILRNETINIQSQFVSWNSIILMIMIIVMTIFHAFGSFFVYRQSSYPNVLRNLIEVFSAISKNRAGSYILLFLPLIIIWSFFEQTFTYFILQTLKSDRNIILFNIQPAHVMVLHPIFLMLFIFGNKYIFNRIFNAINFSTPLKKTIIGCVCGLGAFISALYFEYDLNQSGPIAPKSDEAHFRMINSMKCDYLIDIFIRNHTTFKLKHMDMYENLKTTMEKETENFFFSIRLDEKERNDNPGFCPELPDGKLQLRKGKAMGFLITYVTESKIALLSFEDDVTRSKDLRPKIRILGDTINEKTIKLINEKGKVVYNSSSCSLNQFKLSPGKFIATVNDIVVTESQIKLKESEVYVFIILEVDVQHDFQLIVITHKPIVKIWKIVTQFMLLAFSKSIVTENYQKMLYEEVPEEVKPLVSPLYFLTILLGNLLIVIFASINIFNGEWHYIIFSILVGLNICFLVFLMRHLGKWKEKESVNNVSPNESLDSN